MKKTTIFLCIIFALLFGSQAACAEISRTITTRPFVYDELVINLQYEHGLKNNDSLIVNGKFTLDAITSFWGLEGGYRKYLSDNKFSSYFVEGTAGPLVVSNMYGTKGALNIKGQTGYKWLFKNGFTVELGFGATLSLGKAKSYDNKDSMVNTSLATGFSF